MRVRTISSRNTPAVAAVPIPAIPTGQPSLRWSHCQTTRSASTICTETTKTSVTSSPTSRTTSVAHRSRRSRYGAGPPGASGRPAGSIQPARLAIMNGSRSR
ncbi:hypothetical protein [Pseudonocardia sp. T1-2H]|uniref:hypothetical protein n=1 Tax=Pseudonocardia sp. T1-2H TaxID=3128899 RepID=UPI0031017A4E